MAKIRKIEHINEGQKFYHDQNEYMCLGCRHTHAFALKSEGGHHEFNMDLENPTVTPSLLQNFSGDSKLCHSYITNGNINYLSDCQHDLAGKEVELPQIN